MAQVITFLGKGGVGCSTVAIAAARQLAAQGTSVLFVSRDPSPALGVLLGSVPGPDPQEIAPKLHAVQLQSATLLERGWEQAKQLEAQYLRSPTLKNVYGQELGIFPGLDSALALNALRDYNASNRYEVIVYDGDRGLQTLRMLGIPEIASWYVRRFRKVFFESDLGKAIAPFVQPVSGAVFNRAWSFDDLDKEPDGEMADLLQEGKSMLHDPQRVIAHLVTTSEPAAIATAQYLWGSAQQIGLTVASVLWNQAQPPSEAQADFAPLPLVSLPSRSGDDWQALQSALPNLRDGSQAPPSLTVDTANRQVRVFLPGFDKKQVKLTQSGPEITIEAGDQRRNLTLPPPLKGQPVKGAKFQDRHLVISL